MSLFLAFVFLNQSLKWCAAKVQCAVWNRGDKTKQSKPSNKAELSTCHFQQNSRTSRTSLLRTQRLWLALQNCATVLKLLPGHSLCQDSTTIRRANIESHSRNSQAGQNTGWVWEGGRGNVTVVKCGWCLWIKMTLELLYLFHNQIRGSFFNTLLCSD